MEGGAGAARRGRGCPASRGAARPCQGCAEVTAVPPAGLCAGGPAAAKSKRVGAPCRCAEFFRGTFRSAAVSYQAAGNLSQCPRCVPPPSVLALALTHCRVPAQVAPGCQPRCIQGVWGESSGSSRVQRCPSAASGPWPLLGLCFHQAFKFVVVCCLCFGGSFWRSSRPAPLRAGSLQQVAQEGVWMGPEYLQRRPPRSFSGQPVAVLCHT